MKPCTQILLALTDLIRPSGGQRVVLSLAALLLGAGLSAPTARAQTEDAKLETFFKQYLEERFHMQPSSATQLGDHRFDAQLEDLRPEARAKWEQHTRRTLHELPRRVNRSRLSPTGQVDYDIFRHSLERSLWLTENTHPFEEDPRTYSGYINGSVYLLLAQSTLPRETNVANAIARMRQIPKVVEAAKHNLKRPPRVSTETAIRQARGAINFYQRDLFELAGGTSQKAELEREARKVVQCLQDYVAFLENDLLPRADGDWRLGRSKFARKLELVLDAGRTADQVLADAEAEFQRVRNEMYVIARQLWGTYFPGDPLPPDDPEGRRETIQRVLGRIALDHGAPETLVRDVRATVSKLKQFIRDRHILTLPEPDRCQIIEMPEFERGNSTAYMNSPPPLDPHATGYYAVSPPPKDWPPERVRSYFEEYNNAMLQILSIHEAYPGHYVQFEYANRHGSLIRRVLGSGVYVEGWAVYTEQMMLDQGYGNGDLPLRLTQLKFYLRAVANAILDHKMHCGLITDDEALRFLIEDAFQSEGEARLKIIRAQQTSCQLSTYFVGRMAHYRVRQAVQRELGDRFNLARYHEAVLSLGPVPVKFLPRLVREALR